MFAFAARVLRHGLPSSSASVQSMLRSTAFFHLRKSLPRCAADMLGVHSTDFFQLARRPSISGPVPGPAPASHRDGADRDPGSRNRARHRATDGVPRRPVPAPGGNARHPRWSWLGLRHLPDRTAPIVPADRPGQVGPDSSITAERARAVSRPDQRKRRRFPDRQRTDCG